MRHCLKRRCMTIGTIMVTIVVVVAAAAAAVVVMVEMRACYYLRCRV
jgi:hypothetical protein